MCLQKLSVVREVSVALESDRVDIMDKCSDSEALKFIAEQYKIDITAIKQNATMENNKKYLSMHDHPIWQAPDGYWKTKLPKDNGTKEKRLIKKINKQDVENEVIKYYKIHSQNCTFKDMFDVWVKRQEICGRSDNTIYKYRTDYKRFFEGYPFENYDIREITDEKLSEHILTVLSEKPIRWRAFRDIFGYINGVFEKAIKDKIIEDNPCKYIDLPVYRVRCYEGKVETNRERTFSEEELLTLMDNIRNPKAANSNMISCFAIELAIYTGMRVGEISALMWDDIKYDEGFILIRHSEKMSRINNQFYVSNTKNGKIRQFPLTEQIVELLDKIKEYESNHGWMGDYVFQDANGRVTKRKISGSIRRRTEREGFYNTKSIHDLRRTLNSNLKSHGITTATTSALLGHTEAVNKNNYTYDMSKISENKKVLEEIVTEVTDVSYKNG